MPPTTTPRPVTRRALAVGLAGVVGLAWLTPYSDLVLRGTWLGLTAFPISAFCGLLLLVVVNAPLRAVGRGLARGELLVAYAMMLAGAGIPSFGLTGLLVPYAAGPAYFARPENHFTEAVIHHLPRWLLFGPDAAKALYEGLPPGQQLPAATWIGPTVGWGLLVAGVYLLLTAWAVTLRRPWIEEERLVFPLVQLPCHLTEYDDERARWPALLRDPVVWVFFAIPFGLHAINGLHFHIPAVPAVNVHLIDLGATVPGRVGEAVRPLFGRLLFTVIGLSYLLPSEIAFSLWFFYLFFLVQQVIGAQLGWSMPFVQAYPVRRFVALQMIGGVLVSGSSLIVRVVRSRRQNGPDPDAALTTRGLWLTALAGAALVWTWSDLVGLGWFWPTLLLALFGVFQVVGTRLVAEAGMLYVQHPFRPLNLVLSVVGTAGVTPPRLPALTLLDHLWMLDNRSPLQPALVQGFKLAEVGRIPTRGVLQALGLAVIVAVPLSLVRCLGLLSVHGGTMLNPWFTSYYTNNLWCSWTSHLVLHGEPAHPADLGWLALGAGTMSVLLTLHRTLWRWPLNPLGYLMGASWPMINFWFPVFLGWLLKGLALRIGGARLYRRLLPGFLALILGEYASAGLWVVIDALAGVRGHEIFSF